MLSSFNLNRTKCFVYFDEKDEDIANKYKEAGIEVVCLTKKEAVADPVEQIEKVKVAPKKKTSKKK